MTAFMWYELQTDEKHAKREREEAKKLKKSQWWLTKLNQGNCHYCEERFAASDLTMDHIVPIARGGKSNRGNIVPACRTCNTQKKLHTPAELILNSGIDTKE